MKLKFSNPASASAAKAMEFDWSFWKPTIREALPFGLTGVFGMIYTNISSVMLSVMQGNEVVGWYNAAYRLILVLLFIPAAFGLAIFPNISRFYIISQSSLRVAIEKYFKYMVILALPIAVGTTLVADRIILLVFGQGYTQSIIALQILVWTVVLTFAGAAFVKMFESTNRQIVVARVSGICMAANIILNLLLIPRFSYVGASIATLVTELILVGAILVLGYRTRYGVSRGRLIGNTLRITISSLVMGAFVWYFGNLNLLVLVVLATLLYFGLLYLTKVIDKEDLSLLRQATKSGKN
jgi:O-antigen/teichoic acid export membrane protein